MRRKYRRNSSEPPDSLERWDVEQADGIGERLVCSRTNPRYDKLGMPTLGDCAHPVDGWRGIFVGDADLWLPVLVRDGYCGEKAWVYNIDFDALAAAGRGYWLLDDPNVYDKTETPASGLVVTQDLVVPAFAMKLVRSIPWKECIRMFEEVYGESDDMPF
jgi:hypothetical protein